jgi:excisionase family DNA binding protein
MEVAVVLAVSAATVARYAREGRVPFSTTPGGHRRFNIDEVRSALTRRTPVRVVAISTAAASNRPRVRIGDGERTEVSTASRRRESMRATITPVDTSAPLGHPASPSRAEAVETIIGTARCVLVGAAIRPSPA